MRTEYYLQAYGEEPEHPQLTQREVQIIIDDSEESFVELNFDGKCVCVESSEFIRIAEALKLAKG